MPHHRVTLDEVLFAHETALENGGGVRGVKNQALLESAMARPYTDLMGHTPYDTVQRKAGCLLHSFLCNHGFNDANKRTAWIVCNSFLFTEGHAITAHENEYWYDEVERMVADSWDVEQVIAWVEARCIDFTDVLIAEGIWKE